MAAPIEGARSSAAARGQIGASVDLQVRRVVAVQVNVPGPSAPELVVTGVSPTGRPDGLYLEITIENSGRSLTRGEGTITLPAQGFKRTFAVDTLVPRTSVAYPIKWTDGTDVGSGEHRARVELHYDGRVAQWEGAFTVGRAVRQELAERRIDGSAEAPGKSAMPASVLPGSLFAAGALAAVGGVALLNRRRPAPRL